MFSRVEARRSICRLPRWRRTYPHFQLSQTAMRLARAAGFAQPRIIGPPWSYTGNFVKPRSAKLNAAMDHLRGVTAAVSTVADCNCLKTFLHARAASETRPGLFSRELPTAGLLYIPAPI